MYWNFKVEDRCGSNTVAYAVYSQRTKTLQVEEYDSSHGHKWAKGDQPQDHTLTFQLQGEDPERFVTDFLKETYQTTYVYSLKGMYERL
jgi:hypothetical protein